MFARRCAALGAIIVVVAVTGALTAPSAAESEAREVTAMLSVTPTGDGRVWFREASGDEPPAVWVERGGTYQYRLDVDWDPMAPGALPTIDIPDPGITGFGTVMGCDLNESPIGIYRCTIAAAPSEGMAAFTATIIPTGTGELSEEVLVAADMTGVPLPETGDSPAETEVNVEQYFDAFNEGLLAELEFYAVALGEEWAGYVLSVREEDGALLGTRGMETLVFGLPSSPRDDGGAPLGRHVEAAFLPPLIPQPPGGFVLVDTSGAPIPSEASTVDGEIRVVSAVTVTVRGDRGASGTTGPIAGANGTLVITVSGETAVGQVIEAWIHSSPRLVAAARVEDSGPTEFLAPLGAPLDGGGPISEGSHTLRLLIPTADGTIAANIGVTVTNTVPTAIRAGASRTPTPVFALVATGSMALVLLSGRLTLLRSRASRGRP